MKKVLKNISILGVTLLPNAALAAGLATPKNVSGLSGASLDVTIMNIITAVLGLVGIIALGVILYGGFRWMTAAGNEDAVGEAKKIITAGVIGLIIVIVGWAVVSFVINTVV